MKSYSFYPVKRFLSLLVLNRDIFEDAQEIPHKNPEQHTIYAAPEDTTLKPLPEWEQEEITPQERKAHITIQPEEIGGIEDIDTRIH